MNISRQKEYHLQIVDAVSHNISVASCEIASVHINLYPQPQTLETSVLGRLCIRSRYDERFIRDSQRAARDKNDKKDDYNNIYLVFAQNAEHNKNRSKTNEKNITLLALFCCLT